MAAQTSQALSHAVAQLRAARLLYQTLHWTSGGPNYYGDHLLFMRLYEDLGSPVDDLGERTVGYFGEPLVNATGQAEKMLGAIRRSPDPILMAQSAQQAIQQAYDTAQAEMGRVPLGLDDLLMSIASTLDTHLYLLGQRAKR